MSDYRAAQYRRYLLASPGELDEFIHSLGLYLVTYADEAYPELKGATVAGVVHGYEEALKYGVDMALHHSGGASARRGAILRRAQEGDLLSAINLFNLASDTQEIRITNLLIRTSTFPITKETTTP